MAPPSKAVAMNRDRKSTRLNSSHANISYAVFCLKKKKESGLQPFSLQRRTLRDRQDISGRTPRSRRVCVRLLILFLNRRLPRLLNFFFFFNDTATTEIYTLSLHDALPI